MKYILLLALVITISSYNMDRARTICRELKRQGYTNAGIAGVLGNLEHESHLDPGKYQDSFKDDVGLSDKEYVRRVNSGKYPKDKFVYDEVGFGLAQWTYWEYKQYLYNTCRGKYGNVAHFGCQLDYLIKGIQKKTALINILTKNNNVDYCTEKFLNLYERAEDPQLQSRKNYANDYYNQLVSRGC